MDRWDLRKNQESEIEKKMFRQTLKSKNDVSINDLNNQLNKLYVSQSEVRIARLYQEKIFEEIIERNAIIYAETGRGKTYVAIMLMKHILKNEKKEQNMQRSIIGVRSIFQRKSMVVKPQKSDPKMIFIVPENSLLEQQFRAIEKNIGDYKVTKLLGGKTERYTSSKSNFEDFLSQYDVIVSTHEIIYRLLYSGFLNISDIRLIVFDECHHTDLNHPYNIIMNEFYFYNKINNKEVKLPQILGLTASPIKRNFNNVDPLKIHEELVKLSENMDSVLVMDPDVFDYRIEKGQDELDKLSPDEADRGYIQVNNFFEEESFSSLATNLIKLFNNVLLKEANLPEYCVDRYKEFIQVRLLSKDFQEFTTKINENIELFKLSSDNKVLESIEKLLRHIFILIENTNVCCIYNFLVDYKEEIKKDEHIKSTKIPKIIEKFLELLGKLSIKYESHRMTLLKDYIIDIYSEDNNSHKHRIIIFVDHRIVSKYLNAEINDYLEETINCNNNSVKFKSIYVVGVSKNKKSGKNINNSQTDMVEKLKQFNTGKVHILVATSTVEEGIDIKECDIVIVYTELKTVKSYIQMKGRARKKKAKFMIFTESESSTRERIKGFIEIIKLIRAKFVGKTFVVDLRRQGFLSTRKIEHKFLQIESSNAQVSLRNAPQLYNHLKNLLSNKGIILRPNISYEKHGMDHCPNFVCSFENENPDIYLVSESFNKKDQSLAHCYLQFIEHLLKNRIIDDYFNVINVKFFR